MADLLGQGIDLFNRECWFEAHETWEDLWRETPGDARLFYQGLVQLAVGLHHLTHGNLRGGRNVLLRGLASIAPYPDDYADIDTARLAADIRALIDSPGSLRVRLHRIREPRRHKC
jgi:predicted metal-dependent hydrolase